MSVVPVGYSRNQGTVVTGAGDAALAYNREQTTGVGEIRETGITVTVRNNYAGRYNFAVNNYNCLASLDKKKMRGGHFLLHRYIVILLWLVSMACAGASAVLKPLIAVPIVISVLYIALSIYNIVVFKRNGSLFHPKLMIHNNRLAGSINEWYTVPIHTRIQDTAALAAVGGDNSAAMNVLREEYTNVDEIQIMIYTERYIRLHTYFPRRSIVIHIIGFIISFALGIVLEFNVPKQE
ncbi:unnamed protein product [Adineta steineri]|uniref:Uncharacterized protein n=1 Tax=Adineta steineri TaxID=433720 RepID=A0A819C6V8_9BILA|nr:unnamed protein product [Adineta steineri]CAF3814464.1 unnamed protein product [Adineta steineri]